LSDKGDVDLEQRLGECERFYNYDRPHSAFAGKTPKHCERVTVGVATVSRDPLHHSSTRHHHAALYSPRSPRPSIH
jgi:hypothetical protein